MNSVETQKQENKVQSVSNSFYQKQSGELAFQLVDNRPNTIVQRKLQEMANNSPRVVQLKAFQEMANNSPQVKQSAQLQAMANHYPVQQRHPIHEHVSQLAESVPSANDKVSNSGVLQKSLNTSCPVVQRVYGPSAVTIDEGGVITDIDIHRPGTRPNVPVEVSSTGGEDDVYRHHTNWAVIRDAIGGKYIGLSLADALTKLKEALDINYEIDVTKEKFQELLKIEMNKESQFGAMGSRGANEGRNLNERTKEAEMKGSAMNHEKFQDWTSSTLDIDFKRDAIESPEDKLGFDLKAFTGHVLHTIRAVLFRTRKGSGIDKGKYLTLAGEQTLSDVIQGTIKNFGETDFRKNIIECFLKAKDIESSEKLNQLDLFKLEAALNDYKTFHSLLMEYYFYSTEEGFYEETHQGGYNLDEVGNEERTAKDKYYEQLEMAQEYL